MAQVYTLKTAFRWINETYDIGSNQESKGNSYVKLHESLKNFGLVASCLSLFIPLHEAIRYLSFWWVTEYDKEIFHHYESLIFDDLCEHTSVFLANFSCSWLDMPGNPSQILFLPTQEFSFLK